MGFRQYASPKCFFCYYRESFRMDRAKPTSHHQYQQDITGIQHGMSAGISTLNRAIQPTNCGWMNSFLCYSLSLKNSQLIELISILILRTIWNSGNGFDIHSVFGFLLFAVATRWRHSSGWPSCQGQPISSERRQATQTATRMVPNSVPYGFLSTFTITNVFHATPIC